MAHNLCDDVTEDGEARRIAEQRQAVHAKHTTPRLYDDPCRENEIGVIGERAFARAFGLQHDDRILAEGDGGCDFRVILGKRNVTIDVKTAARPVYLLVKTADIASGADLYVLAHLDRGAVSFVGWETRAIMALMPTAEFSPGIESHFRHREQLRPMGQLVDLMALRAEIA